MDLSIIIISKDTKTLLKDCLESIYHTLKESRITYEVIVVDNASTDGSTSYLRTLKHRCILIENNENVGFGVANNQGIQKSTGDSILLLNSDTIVQTGAIERLYRFSKNHPQALVGPKLINPDKTPQTSCGPFFSLPVVFGILFLKGDVLGLTRWSPNSTARVDWVSGACLLAPKRVFLDGLLFDENIFMYMDEIDLLYRAKKKGYEVYFYPESNVVHIGSGSSKNKRKGPIINIYRGFMWFYTKHHTRWETAVLKGMLQCKAMGGILLGRITGNEDMRSTYEEAYRMVQ